MTPNDARRNTPAEAGFAAALQKNKEAAAAVEDVALELGVVHAVLSTEIAKVDTKVDATDEIHTAIDRTEALEAKLSETAEKMDEVNAALAAQRASSPPPPNTDK